MPGELAEVSLTASVRTPVYVPASRRCDRMTFLCADDSARQGWNMSGPPAPPPTSFELAHARAEARNSVNEARLEQIRQIIESDLSGRMTTVVLFVLGFIVSCWFYRAWRFKQRHRYRVAHDYI